MREEPVTRGALNCHYYYFHPQALFLSRDLSGFYCFWHRRGIRKKYDTARLARGFDRIRWIVFHFLWAASLPTALLFEGGIMKLFNRQRLLFAIHAV